MKGALLEWPWLGHMPGFHADTTGFLLRLARERGDVARFRIGRRPAYLFAHPEGVASVLVAHAPRLTKGNLMQRARRLLGDGLLTSEGELHRAQRRRVQTAFTRERVERYAEQVPTVVASRTARWNGRRRIALNAEMDDLALSVVARSLFGHDVLDEVPALGPALRTVSRWCPAFALPGGAWLERRGVPPLRRVHRAIAVIEGAIERLGRARDVRSPLLDALLDDRPGAPRPPERLVRDELMTVFLAGHDTTAAALSWIWLLLSAHPAVEARLHREIRDVVGGRDVRASDAAALTYTRAVVEEVLRLYPPVGRIGRKPTEAMDIAGVAVPAGAAVFVSPFVTQRDGRWFERPDEFVPERWSTAIERPRFAYFPFGGGRRSCVGESFAREALVVATAALAQRWRLHGPDALPRPRSLLTTKPRSGISVRLEPRTRCGPV